MKNPVLVEIGKMLYISAMTIKTHIGFNPRFSRIAVAFAVLIWGVVVAFAKFFAGVIADQFEKPASETMEGSDEELYSEQEDYSGEGLHYNARTGKFDDGWDPSGIYFYED